MTPPDPSTSPAGPPRPHARATGRSPSGTGPSSAGVARPHKALLFIYVFIFAVGVIGSILSSAAVRSGFYIVAIVAGLLAFTRINSMIFLERTSGSSSRRGFQGLSGGRDQDFSLHAGNPLASTGWRMMQAVAWLMPRAVGTRWLAEAISVLQETPHAQRHQVVRSYLFTAPEVIAMSWAGHLARRIRPH